MSQELPTPEELAAREWAAIGASGRAAAIISYFKQQLMSPPSLGISDCALRADAGRRNALADILRMLESETALVDTGQPPRLPAAGQPTGRNAARGLRRRGQLATD